MVILPNEILEQVKPDGTIVWDSFSPEYAIDQDIFNFYLNGELIHREVVQYTDTTKEFVCK